MRNRKSVSPKLAASYAKCLGYPQDQFVRLCLQDMLDKAKLNMTVDTKLNRSKNSSKFEFLFTL